MGAIHLHLALVHVPVVGLPLALAGWALARRRGDRFWEGVCAALWAVLGLAALAAYASGGAAHEHLRQAAGRAWPARGLAESHAATARAALVLHLASIAALLAPHVRHWSARAQGDAPAAGDDTPGKGLPWLTLGLGVAACLLLALAAFQGGLVGHPEIR